MNFPETERKILKLWDKKKIFRKSVTQRKKGRFFTFYDGPPFATGLPHYGHILATAIKDTVTRFFAMRGFRVERRVGWDCHGLPVENMIEKELGIKSKKEIEKYGVKKFNQACQASVFRCVKDWETTLYRVGRWADYSKAYTTMDRNYTESVWWVFKKLFEQGLVYKAWKVAPYCPRCGTPLSNFEMNQPGAYKDVEDVSVYLKFPVKGETNNFFLAWTTTPWTLPGNIALAVGENINYVKVKVGDEKYILAKERLEEVLGKDYEIETEFLGGALIGREYEPVFPQRLEKQGYKVVAADFVSTQDGSGIVHLAPAFGEDDMAVAQKENLPILVTVEADGKIKKGLEIPGEGKFVKDAEEEIRADLKKRKLLFKEEKITHAYPFCWRCDTLLLYYPVDTWYIAVSKFKDELLKNNERIHWVPDHLKHGRFGKWLEGARDWAVSRNRYWGAPLPIWICQKCGQMKVVGSFKELDRKIINFHRPHIDEIKLKCASCEGEMKRVEEVFDCWFESGAMPYAQWHYPFENKKLVEENFPADFIGEGVDQTRGWFYTLHVLAGALTLKDLGLGEGKPAFKNVIVNGLLLAEDGKKLSKKLRNYTPPEEIMEKFGADTLRFFLLTGTPVGDDQTVSDKRIEETYRKTISTFWHTFVFLRTYIEKKFKPKKNFQPKSALDRWAVSRLNETAEKMIEKMEDYQLTDAGRLWGNFIEDLSNWYVRRSRRRLQKPKNSRERNEASQALYYVLINTAKLGAPFIPFLCEEIYLGLKKPRMPESVHLCDFPEAQKDLINKDLEEKMTKIRELVTLALAERASKGIKIRQPLQELGIRSRELEGERELLELLAEEINVKEINFDETLKAEIWLDTKITKELKEEGLARELVRQIQEARKEAGLSKDDEIVIAWRSASPVWKKIIEKWGSFVKEENLAREIEPFSRDAKYLLEKELAPEEGKIKIGILKA